MIVILQTQALQTLEQIRAFVTGTEPVSFTLADRCSALAWMADTLKRFGYANASRGSGGAAAVSGKGHGSVGAQVARRITQFLNTGQVRDRRTAPARPFARRFTDADVALLATTTRCTARSPGRPPDT